MLNDLNALINILVRWLEKADMPKWIANDLSVIILSVGIVSAFCNFLYGLYKQVILIFNQRFLNRNLKPLFRPSEVRDATKFYIETRYQNVAPDEDAEPGRRYIAAAKNKLIPLFTKTILSKPDADGKFFLILADTGMGKTTFLLNLYLRYANRIRFLPVIAKYDIVIYPLGWSDTIDRIDKIANKKNTILLLDAFDEDIRALDNHKEEMNFILSKAYEFKYIIITCRTQFFPSEDEEPHRTGYFSFGGEGEYVFQKLYVSVFDENDVKKYIRKRFPIYRQDLRAKAFRIAKNSPNLVVRPLLLSYIKDLIDSKKVFKYSFEIYEVLISKWIHREASKPGIAKKYQTVDKYEKKLYQFSKELAIILYQKRKDINGYYIKNDYKFPSSSSLQFSHLEEDQVVLTDKEKKTRSLLNRDSQGRYKFSHKSILEYFLAVELFNNPSFYKDFDFEGMDAARQFLRELLVSNLLASGMQYSFDLPKSVSQISDHSLPNIKESKISLRRSTLKKAFRKQLKTLFKSSQFFKNKKANYSTIIDSAKMINCNIDLVTTIPYLAEFRSLSEINITLTNDILLFLSKITLFFIVFEIPIQDITLFQSLKNSENLKTFFTQTAFRKTEYKQRYKYLFTPINVIKDETLVIQFRSLALKSLKTISKNLIFRIDTTSVSDTGHYRTKIRKMFDDNKNSTFIKHFLNIKLIYDDLKSFNFQGLSVVKEFDLIYLDMLLEPLKQPEVELIQVKAVTDYLSDLLSQESYPDEIELFLYSILYETVVIQCIYIGKIKAYYSIKSEFLIDFTQYYIKDLEIILLTWKKVIEEGLIYFQNINESLSNLQSHLPECKIDCSLKNTGISGIPSTHYLMKDASDII